MRNQSWRYRSWRYQSWRCLSRMAEMPSLGRLTTRALGKNCYLAGMAISHLSSRLLAAGPGWSVSDFVCRAGPHDPPFQEQHETACIAAVTEGSFQYRST